MNAILSFIVCIAMLVSPTGMLPAKPETATTWTISDLTIAVGDESVTLAPEARFAAAVGAEEEEPVEVPAEDVPAEETAAEE